MGPTAPGFAERFRALCAERGPFCLGLDPTPDLLRAWGLEDDIWGLKKFCARVVDAAEQKLSVIKPQAAYFERFGAAGLEVLADAIESIHTLGSLALLDVKRGDIGSTNEAYAEALLGPDSPMGADAITVHGYMGFEALGPFLDRALATGSGVFVVVLSSNPEGAAIQAAQVSPGTGVAEHLADAITAFNRAHADRAGVGPVGAVVGVTAERAANVVARLPASLVLTPGLGAQGGTWDAVRERFGAARGRILPTSSRGVLAQGPDLARLGAAIREHAERAREALS
jgi:orotidine-5'-phosphate decarboxylase